MAIALGSDQRNVVNERINAIHTTLEATAHIMRTTTQTTKATAKLKMRQPSPPPCAHPHPHRCPPCAQDPHPHRAPTLYTRTMRPPYTIPLIASIKSLRPNDQARPRNPLDSSSLTKQLSPHPPLWIAADLKRLLLQSSDRSPTGLASRVDGITSKCKKVLLGYPT